MLQVEQSTAMEDILQDTAIQVTQALIGTSGFFFFLNCFNNNFLIQSK